MTVEVGSSKATAAGSHLHMHPALSYKPGRFSSSLWVGLVRKMVPNGLDIIVLAIVLCNLMKEKFSDRLHQCKSG